MSEPMESELTREKFVAGWRDRLLGIACHMLLDQGVVRHSAKESLETYHESEEDATVRKTRSIRLVSQRIDTILASMYDQLLAQPAPAEQSPVAGRIPGGRTA